MSTGSWSTGNWSKVDLTGETYGLQDEFDTGSSQFSPTQSGIYSVAAQIEYSATGGSTKYYIAIVVNGAVYAQSIKVQDLPNTPTAVSIAQDVALQPGDTLEIHGRQESGVGLLFLAKPDDNVPVHPQDCIHDSLTGNPTACCRTLDSSRPRQLRQVIEMGIPR